MLVALSFVIALLLVGFGGYMASIEAAMAVQGADIRDVNAVGFVRIISETTAAVLVTLAFVRLLDSWWLALLLSALIMTAASFVLVGTSPRSVGRAHAVGILRLSRPLIAAFRAVLGPIASLLVAIGDRVTPSRARSAVSSEEQLLSIVDDATEHDVLEEEDAELIHSIFEFNDTVVREVMVPRTDMVTVDLGAKVGTAMSLFLGRGVSRIPVIDGDADDVTGVLYLRDAARLAYERPAEADSAAVSALQKPAAFVPESMNADELLRQMQRESNHLALVVDEYGGIAGLVTLEDLIEELVGDISDEYDREEQPVEPLGDGGFRVPARFNIEELGDLFELEIEDDEVDSVGGMLSKALGKLPVSGDEASAHGLVLTAERTEGRRGRISTVLVRRDTIDSDD